MSMENLEKMLKLANENEAVGTRLKEIGVADTIGLIDYGKELGFEFNEQDLTAWGERMLEMSDELGEEQLDKVSGGFIFKHHV